MSRLLLLAFVAAAAFAQTGKFGPFTASDDVGGPALSGSAECAAASGPCRITGTGADIWGKADQFHYVWREMSGNFAITATAKFLSGGNAHRKASLMLRKSLAGDSPFFHLAIHGDGMPSVQFRSTPGDNVQTVDFPVAGPGTFRLKLVRESGRIRVWVGKDAGTPREFGNTNDQLGSPVLVGLAVSSHDEKALNTVLFSDVSLEPLPAAGESAAQTLGLFTNSGDVGGPAARGSVVYSAAGGQYRVSGAGADLWGKQDQFHYLWRELTGNFAITATVRLLGEGHEHRKAGIMVRQSTDPGAAYGDVMIHGNGEAALQWRTRQGEATSTFDLPIEGPGTFRVKLVRTGVRIFMYLAREGGALEEIAHTEVTFRGPVLAGLAVCSHADALTTALFSDVSVETEAPR